MTSRIYRLACLHCDRQDMDGITAKELEQAKAEGWTEITEEQSLKESRDTEHGPLTHWWTSIGVCPECQDKE